jgi:hypothetical protein
VKKTLKRCPSLGLRWLNLFLLTGDRVKPIAPIGQPGRDSRQTGLMM